MGDSADEHSDGRCVAHIQFQGRTVQWEFIRLPSLSTAIMGVDFLEAHHDEVSYINDTATLQLRHRSIAPQRQL